MAREFTYRPKMVCSTEISFELDDENKVHDLRFRGGCNGNLKAIGRLVEGQEASKVAEILRGNTCGPRQTSCADQLSKALEQAVAEKNA
ncbi:MAG TPA: TIGR03905 family TSCPD domain-containing protein [Oribacterium sp.]|nr:TIGR03905 family TSCPD domain-containing protein [Oribacterium sp.]